ncbi:MAG TPA: substrate-binding domain-containing protein [Bryobacteraceae bacterium]
MPVQTHLEEIRKSRGFSAVNLAHRVGVSRQTIYAIEDGSYVPNTTVALHLARVLDVTVEEIFSIAGEPESEALGASLLVDDPAANKGPLVRVCRVYERLVAVPVSSLPAYLPAADGVIESRKKLSVSVSSPAAVPADGKRLLLAGCDPALSLLGELLHSSGMEIIAVPSSSRCALRWLKQGRVHAAGSHLLDRLTGDYNLPMIRRYFPKDTVRVVTFAVWEQGLVVQRGNPKSIRSIADLSGKGVRIINREKGAGSRDLLDTGLRKAGISARQISGYESVADGHLAAAYAVATKTADCCVAPRSAARCFGLDFIPLAVERFDLSFNKAAFELPATKAVLDLLNRSALRKKLQVIAGYDATHTGEVLI